MNSGDCFAFFLGMGLVSYWILVTADKWQRGKRFLDER